MGSVVHSWVSGILEDMDCEGRGHSLCPFKELGGSVNILGCFFYFTAHLPSKNKNSYLGVLNNFLTK